MRTPTEAELAYIAGILDGEGCIYISVGIEKRGWRLDFARISVKMCDPQAIHLVNEIFPGKLRLVKKPTIRHRNQLEWRLMSRPKISRFVSLIKPYTRVKTEQIEVLEAFLATFKGYHLKGKGATVPLEVVETRKQLQQRCKELKRAEIEQSSQDVLGIAS